MEQFSKSTTKQNIDVQKFYSSKKYLENLVKFFIFNKIFLFWLIENYFFYSKKIFLFFSEILNIKQTKVKQIY